MGNRTFTQVPPDSTGDKLAMRNRTKGGETVLEQSVYLSEEETYSVVADAVAFAANKHHITIHNASGSGVTVRVYKILPINLSLTAVTGVGVRFEVKKTSGTPSAGTTLTPEKFDSNNSNLPAGVTVRTNGTVTDGNLIFPIAFNNDEIPLTLLNGNNQIRNIFFDDLKSQVFTLRETEGLTVKQLTSTTVGSFAWLIVFSVESTNADV
jgi:hypothetical protein